MHGETVEYSKTKSADSIYYQVLADKGKYQGRKDFVEEKMTPVYHRLQMVADVRPPVLYNAVMGDVSNVMGPVYIERCLVRVESDT